MTDEELNQRFKRIEDQIDSNTTGIIIFTWVGVLILFLAITVVVVIKVP